MQKKAFVLLSGGMDSTTCLYKAAKDGFDPKNFNDDDYSYNDWISERRCGMGPDCTWVEAVSIFYGQRHKNELNYAKKTCEMLGIKHTILDVGDLLKGKNILLSGDSIGSMEMVHKDYSELKGVSPSYVPFRNGLLLSAITAHAQKYVNEQIETYVFRMSDQSAVPDEERIPESEILSASDLRQLGTANAKDLVTIYYGAHAEDAAGWAYPDCTPEFNGSMANAIYTGSYNTIRLATPLQWLEKWQIVKLGEDLGVDWKLTWSCYSETEQHCGECPTCRARKAAFERANVVDPTVYLA